MLKPNSKKFLRVHPAVFFFENGDQNLKIYQFAIAFLLYAIPQDAYSRNQSLACHSEIIRDRSPPPTFEICGKQQSKSHVNMELDICSCIIHTCKISLL
jgi:hypothetical protein